MIERFLDTRHHWNRDRHLRPFRPRQHDDRNAEAACRRDLAIRGRPAAVLGNDDIDIVLREKTSFVGFVEWAASGKIDGIRHRKRRLDRIDAADEIEVLRPRRERDELIAAECKEYATWRGAERLHGGRHVGNFGPAVAVDRDPGGTIQRQKRNLCEGRGGGRIGGDACRIGMRRIDQEVDRFGAEPSGEADGAAETADAYQNRLRRRRRGAPGERQRHREIGARRQALGELPRLRGAAENEDAFHDAR